MRVLGMSLVAVLVASGVVSSVDGQEAGAQVETRTIGVVIEDFAPNFNDSLNAAFALALDDFNRWLAAENRGWLLEAEIIQVPDFNNADAVIEGLANQNIAAVASYLEDAGLEIANSTIHERNVVLVTSSDGMRQIVESNDNIFRTGNDREHLTDAVVELLSFGGVDEVLLITHDDDQARLDAGMMDARVAEEEGMRMLGAVYGSPWIPGDVVKMRDSAESLLAGSQEGAKVAVILHMAPAFVPDIIAHMKPLDAVSDPPGKVTFHGWWGSLHAIKQHPDVLDFLGKVGYHVLSAGIHDNDVNRSIDSAFAKNNVTLAREPVYDSYDALYILGLAIDKAGTSTDADKIREQMHSAAEEHVSARGLLEGDLQGFDAIGERATLDYHELTLVDGEYVLSKEYNPYAHPSESVIDFLAAVPVPPPARQVAEGVAPEDVECRDGLVLMLRNDGSPICVTPASSERFAAMGIATVVEDEVEPAVPAVDFTDAEKEWLAENPVIRVAYDPGWPPYEYLDESGMLAGVTRDRIDIFAAITGSEFIPVDTSSWSESLEHMRAGTADMLLMAEKTEARSEYMDFTEPWLIVTTNIISSSPDEILPEDLHNYRVMTCDRAVGDWLDRELPNVEYVPATSDLDALAALGNGTMDVFLDPWLTVEHIAAMNDITGIYNVGVLGDEYVLSAAYTKNNDVFGSILQKMLDAIRDGTDRMNGS